MHNFLNSLQIKVFWCEKFQKQKVGTNILAIYSEIELNEVKRLQILMIVFVISSAKNCYRNASSRNAF